MNFKRTVSRPFIFYKLLKFFTFYDKLFVKRRFVMEKFKNFVCKFHWLFKLAAIALLLVVIFAPTVSYLSHRTPFTSPWAFILHFLDLGEIPFNSQSSYVWFSCWTFVLISTFLAILLLVSIFYKKILCRNRIFSRRHLNFI